MTPWSVTATAGLSCSAALPTRSRMRDAPSRSENSVWLCRCTKPSLPISPPPDDNPRRTPWPTPNRERREVAPDRAETLGKDVGKAYSLVIRPGGTLHSGSAGRNRKGSGRRETLLQLHQHV